MGKDCSKAPVRKGEQGQEQFAHTTDYTKKNCATEIQETEACNTD